MSKKKINVLVVEDAKTVQMLLVHILNSDPHIQTIGAVGNGREALEFLTSNSPDVILMDVEMPQMDGFEATRRIMETQPVPIIICTGSANPKESITTFRLMEAGAVACLEKPVGTEHKDYEAMAAALLQTVKLMSEVKVVRRWAKTRRDTFGPTSTSSPSSSNRSSAKIDLIGIGASTGGPPVLQAILTGLPKDFPVPLLVVQHISPGFVAGLVEWLNQTTGLKVHIAAHGAPLIPGHVYFAPDDFHMGVAADGRIALSRQNPNDGLRPSVAHLFRSLAEVCGSRAMGVLLTGMGKDGAVELKLMKDRGAVTIAQDRESSVVHGMPGEAIALGAAMYVLPADVIAGALTAVVNQHPIQGGKS